MKFKSVSYSVTAIFQVGYFSFSRHFSGMQCFQKQVLVLPINKTLFLATISLKTNNKYIFFGTFHQSNHKIFIVHLENPLKIDLTPFKLE